MGQSFSLFNRFILWGFYQKRDFFMNVPNTKILNNPCKLIKSATPGLRLLAERIFGKMKCSPTKA